MTRVPVGSSCFLPSIVLRCPDRDNGGRPSDAGLSESGRIGYRRRVQSRRSSGREPDAVLALSDDARALYAALVATEGDLAAARERAPEVDAGAATRELARLQLIRKARGRYAVVSPAVAESRVAGEMEAKAHTLLADAAATRRAYAELTAVYGRATSHAASELLRTSAEANARLHEVSRHARRTVASAHPTLALPEILEASLEDDRGMVGRGVTRRDLYPHSSRRSRPAMRYFSRMREIGVEVRTTPVIPTRLILIDQDVAIVPVTTGEGVAALVHDPAVVAFLHDYFDYLWDRAQPLSEEADEAVIPREAELAVLAELATGRSDEAIARHLGMSTRTLRRHLATLMARLGVETRFQLGVVASRDGLVGASVV